MPHATQQPAPPGPPRGSRGVRLPGRQPLATARGRNPGHLEAEQEAFLSLPPAEAAARLTARLGGGPASLASGATATAAASEATPRVRPPTDLETPFAGVLQARVRENEELDLDRPEGVEEASRFSRRLATPTGFPSVREGGRSRFARERRAAAERHAEAAAPFLSSPSPPPPLQEDIHEENLRKLVAMSGEEIRVAQEEVLAQLSPEVVEMLRKRGQARASAAPASAASRPASVQEPLPVREGGAPVPKADPLSAPEPQAQADEPTTAPHAALEALKLAWTRPTTQDSATLEEKQALRFDLHGAIVPREADLPVHLGLHHHGKSPDRAGYTIEELTMYAKSTVPAQRALGYRILQHVLVRWKGVDGRRAGPPYSADEAAQVWPALRRHKVLLALRIGLDDRSETVVSAALAALHVWVCCALSTASLANITANTAGVGQGEATHGENLEQVLWTSMALTTGGSWMPELGATLPTHHPAVGAASLEEIYGWLEGDWVRALLETNLLVRLRVLLQQRGALGPVDRHHALALLLGLVRASSLASFAVCQDAELLHHLLELMVLPERQAVLAMQLVRVACLRDAEAFRRIHDTHALENLIRHLVLDVERREREREGRGIGAMDDPIRFALETERPEGKTAPVDEGSLDAAGAGTDPTLPAALVREALLLLELTFARGAGSTMFDEYYGVFFAACQHYVPEQGELAVAALKLLGSLVRSLAADVGSFHDRLRPFLGLVLDVLEGAMQRCARASLSLQQGLEVLEAYLASLQARDALSHASLCAHLANADTFPWAEVQAQGAHLLQAGLAITLSITTPAILAPGLMHQSQCASALRRVEAARVFELADVLLRLYRHLPQRLCLCATPEEVAALCQVLEARPCTSWTRFFSRAQPQLLHTWLVVHLQQPESLPLLALVRDHFLASLSHRMPGEQALCALALRHLLFHPALMERGALPPSPELLAFYASALRLEVEGPPSAYTSPFPEGTACKSLFPEHWISLPLREQGRFLPLALVRECMGLYMAPPHPALMPAVTHELLFALLLREFPSGGGNPAEAKGAEGGEAGTAPPPQYAFEDAELCQLLEQARTMLPPAETLQFRQEATSDGHPTTPTARAEGVSLQLPSDAEVTFCTTTDGFSTGLYEAALQHFNAVSFGNATFAAFLLLPLSMRFPAAYRRLFWGVLGPNVRLFRQAGPPSGEDRGGEYFEPLETDLHVLAAQREALAWLDADRTPFLHALATHHLQGARAARLGESMSVTRAGA